MNLHTKKISETQYGLYDGAKLVSTFTTFKSAKVAQLKAAVSYLRSQSYKFVRRGD